MNVHGWLIVGLALYAGSPSLAAESSAPPSIHGATLGESGQKTAEISTEELRRVLADKSAHLFDARPPLEFAISHIPGALNVARQPGVSISLYVSDLAEIERRVGGNKAAAVVLYRNGPFCGKSKRLADSLLAAGFTNVRRYQLGIPVWRALGGVTEIEPAGLRYVLENDRTAVVIDAREAESSAADHCPMPATFRGAWCSRARMWADVKRAKDDGRLPMNDHNTRLIVIGRDADQARHVAQALVREAFHNVAYFPGAYEQARAALLPEGFSLGLKSVTRMEDSCPCT